MENLVWHAWKPAAWLSIAGDDALTFLQGQFTNDLRGVSVAGGGEAYGLWLNQKGRVLADSFVLRGAGGTYWVGSYFSAAEEIRARLESYIIADDVSVDDVTDHWCGVSVLGDAGAAVFDGIEAWSFGGRRDGGRCTEWIFKRAQEAEVRARLAVWMEIDATEMERRRVAAGIPAVPRDIGPGDLPNEGGLEQTAISFTKGCYLGQEVMARLKSMGQVRRRLARVGGRGLAPAPGEALWQAGKKVGELRSVVAEGPDFAGMAMLTLHGFRGEMALQTGDGTELRWEAFV